MVTRNIDYDGGIEAFFDGMSSDKYALAFTINFDISTYRAATRDDPPEYPEVTVNSVKLRRNGERVDCPAWLEEMILDAVDEDMLIGYATEDAE
jgi:hypothetical protein